MSLTSIGFGANNHISDNVLHMGSEIHIGKFWLGLLGSTFVWLGLGVVGFVWVGW